VEPFRRADWNDFTMGLVTGGIPRELRQAADAEFPVTDFSPKAIIQATVAWLARHPLQPAPPFRGRAALAPHRPRLSPPRAGGEGVAAATHQCRQSAPSHSPGSTRGCRHLVLRSGA
jgi:hypothetical protein